MLKDILEIFLITHNRKTYLQKTFNQIFADNSPIKNFDITILNNNSNDGTTELIEKYREKFNNIKHIIHNRNIGGNANIARAFEIAKKKYVWILCDDDTFDFTYWNKLEEALLSNQYDLVVVANYINPSKNLAQLVGQLTFVPAGIYRTKYIDTDVMVSIEYNIPNMFPHLIFVFEMINNNRQIKILDNYIVKMIPNCGEDSYVRDTNKKRYTGITTMFWQVGFLNSIHMLRDLNKRKEILEDLCTENNNLKFLSLDRIIEANKTLGKNSTKNLFDVFYSYSVVDKNIASRLGLCIAILTKCSIVNNKKVILEFILNNIIEMLKKVVVIYKTDKGYNIKFFDRVKIRIWTNKLFS
ncbi:MAG: glycosyltransferase [Clostridiales Family XIII bacterium]|jgi:glycosyltransferase involved in cell wall biosynthesis|nr:glycosyltransferase [Clostridiales Family XIII bacterium]